MKKLIIPLVLLSIVLISGCIGDNATGNIIVETEDNVQMEYHNGECRRDTDCLSVYCRDTPLEIQCMNTVQVLTEMRCQEVGGIASEKNYEVCGCVEEICQ